MTDRADATVSVDPAERVELLEARWRRERTARLESERIAEAGLRRLWELTQELDERVEQRTAEAGAARAVAEAAAAAKTEFLANLSHEVGTPLQTILAALDLARPVNDADRRRFEDASRAALDLKDLFRNLLELSQLEAGGIDVRRRPVELRAMADDLTLRWRDRFIARGVLLVPESSGRAETDPDRLSQIGDALLDNAAKFAGPGTVRLALTREGDELCLVVADDGPGIDPGAAERIFEPFVQLDGANDRTVSGAGIGLALVRGLSSRLGGSVTAGPSGTGGLAVTVRLPAAPAADPIIPRRTP